MDAFKYTAEKIAAMKILLPAFERYEYFLAYDDALDDADRYCVVTRDMKIAIEEHEQLAEDAKAGVP